MDPEEVEPANPTRPVQGATGASIGVRCFEFHTEAAHTEAAHTEAAHSEAAHTLSQVGQHSQLGQDRILMAFNWKLSRKDLEQETDFIRNYLLRIHGAKRFSAIQLYIGLYSIAQLSRQCVVRANRPTLIAILAATSNSTVSRAIQFGAEMGLFEVQTMNVRRGELAAGTYFNLKFPWM